MPESAIHEDSQASSREGEIGGARYGSHVDAIAADSLVRERLAKDHLGCRAFVADRRHTLRSG